MPTRLGYKAEEPISFEDKYGFKKKKEIETASNIFQIVFTNQKKLKKTKLYFLFVSDK